MYFTHNSRNYTCNLDWLQYSVHLKEAEPEIYCPDGYRIEICQGNNIFEHRAMVFDQRGGKFLTLLWKPYSKVLPANLMTCQVANEYLYMSEGAGVRWSWEVLQQIVECTFNGVGRFDLCLDFEADDHCLDFIKHLNSGHYYTQAKSEGSTWWHETSKGDYRHKQLHCLTWGSAKSEIKVKLYHKSREQGVMEGGEPEKPWIVQQWRVAGMRTDNVWRLEFSLSGAGQLRHAGKPITLDLLQSNGWLLDVYCDLYCHRFVTRINQGRRNGHHNDDERVWLLDLPAHGIRLKWADPKGDDYEMPPAITLLRSMMRQIDNPTVMASQTTFADYAGLICRFIDNYHLEGYFRRTYEQPSEDYFSALYDNAGQGLRHCTLSPSRLMD